MKGEIQVQLIRLKVRVSYAEAVKNDGQEKKNREQRYEKGNVSDLGVG